MNMSETVVLGVRVDNLTQEEARQKVRAFLSDGKQHKIFTPNPEMLVKAQKDEYFKKVLNEGDLNLCDGFGLSLFSGAPRITGVDFMLELCALAEEQGRSVYLLGSGSDEVVKKTAEELTKKFPNLKITGYDKGPIIDENVKFQMPNSKSNNNVTMESPTASRDPDLGSGQFNNVDILFVAFGMGKQEKWIYENLSEMPGVKIAMGVGGAFDYISGAVPRAPGFMRAFGLEWMYRLIRQPRRIKRIINATVKFVYLILKEKI